MRAIAARVYEGPQRTKFTANQRYAISREIPQNSNLAVQGHPKSSTLVPVESACIGLISY